MALNKQTNSKGKSCPEYKKLQCFQGVLISDTMCKEPLWVREGVSLDRSNRGHKDVPFTERDQSMFLCLEEEFKAQQGHRDYLLYRLQPGSNSLNPRVSVRWQQGFSCKEQRVEMHYANWELSSVTVTSNINSSAPVAVAATTTLSKLCFWVTFAFMHGNCIWMQPRRGKPRTTWNDTSAHQLV